ncbi:T9SS type A sorting domain-containing protein [Olleya sp. HaHaR_3_96]|uniref:T9SS type A sorting domain-containing protein n=1 Tax=Olleya sp. HaHaR_3_96 TaxID=2745560 RepID=UPI001C4F7307|nr:T9SS type A sorting domain-containing protein [Olleya sp. HaHaR_3_96]QXP58245.1 T9SS type A sorting domain-containing protein [Olleya sp. HaHaR_3_96]
MRKITLLFSLIAFAFSIKGFAQFGCDSGVVITDGFTASGITTPGDGGAEDWNDNPTDTPNCGAINVSWDDDVYLFTYTAGVTDEEISMTTFSRSAWNGLGIFTTCTGTALNDCIDTNYSSSVGSTKTVTANILAGQTVFIASGTNGPPNGLDFDVTAFSVVPLASPPNCTTISVPANGASDVSVNGDITWLASQGEATDYLLEVGTTSGGTDVFSGQVGNVTTYNVGALTESTTYYVTITPSNANGVSTGCTEESFTTVARPACASNLVATPDATCGSLATALSWDAVANAEGYTLTVGTTSGGNDIIDDFDLGNVLTYEVDSQTASTSYYWTIVPYNTVGGATACGENSYTTVSAECYCTSTTTLINGTGIGNLQVGTTDFASGGILSYEDFTGAPVDLEQGIGANVMITFETGFDYGVNIWIDFNDDLVFEASELLYTGLSSSGNPTTLDASFSMPTDAALGTHRMRIGTDDDVADASDPCNSTSWHVTMDVDVTILEEPCAAPTATATIVADCDNAQFFVDVNVTGLGDGTSVINDGTTTYPATSLGVVQIGPYVNGSTVSVTLENGTDTTCDTSLGDYNNICPPANDNCENAEVIIPSTTGSEVWYTGTTISNTPSGEVADTDVSCGSFGSGRDVWYTVEVPAAGDITIVTQAALGSALTDTTISVFSGSCGAMAGTEIACDDNSGTDNFSEIVLTGQVPGAILYVRVQEHDSAVSNSANDGQFEVSAHAAEPTLSTVSFETNSLFTYYPNPVNDSLILNAQKEISNVSVYNMIGQEVYKNTPNSVNNAVDMSNLQSGAYFIKVTIDNVTETVKVIKK